MRAINGASRRGSTAWGGNEASEYESSATRAGGSALNLSVHFHTLMLDGVYPYEPDRRVPQVGGMSQHADVAIPAHDRRRLERICRYVARPPFASE